MMDAPNNNRVKVPNNSATSASVESEDANEALSPNPASGRDEADDHTSRESKLVSCKQTLRVAILNVRTLNGVQRQSELCNELQQAKNWSHLHSGAQNSTRPTYSVSVYSR